MKSGPTVDKKIFRDFPIEDTTIYALGRANGFPANEVDHYPDKEFVAPRVLEPNGNIITQNIKKGEVVKNKVDNFFINQCGPQISPVRLFIRRHILSRFK